MLYLPNMKIEVAKDFPNTNKKEIHLCFGEISNPIW